MPEPSINKYRAAMDVLIRGRDQLVEALAEDVLEQEENFRDAGFQFHEFLETQGARLHFLGLIMGHLEQSAELVEEQEAQRTRQAAAAKKGDPSLPRKRSKSRNAQSSKPRRQAPPDSEGSIDDIPF
ncbi:hypothetical protein OJF2_65470 [Aquisphaera giovannonii]|uniref:Uncharacterized protein n=1 Tax=Aquisphaera giovannonii TaxID=406548 RepID=A0A5B9WDC8_9BACT|nr:hypothetical protein [Aquisphaera giovannonii]QEH37951.1 hypothetical protein OJF2_65470 [Aquisphaera giovannonii]